MERTKTMDWIIGIHKELWNRTDYIPDLQPRAQATNTLFIEMMKRVRNMEEPPRGAMEVPLPAIKPPTAVESPTATPGSAPAEVVPHPGSPEGCAHPKRIDVTAQADEGQKELCEDCGEIIEKPAPTVNAFDITPEDATRLYGTGYDSVSFHWKCCVKHPQENIDFVSDRTGKPYQKCEQCHEYLNVDGKRVHYDPATGVPEKPRPLSSVPPRKEIRRVGSQ